MDYVWNDYVGDFKLMYLFIFVSCFELNVQCVNVYINQQQNIKYVTGIDLEFYNNTF